VDRLSADVMVGVEERLGQQVAHVRTPQAVHDAPAVTGAFDEPGEAQFGQMLAGHGWSTTGHRGEGSDVGFVFTKLPQDPHPRRVRQ